MLKQCALILLSLSFVIPAQAGLLEDDEARKQIQQLETRLLKLEDSIKQQTKSMLDLQSQIDSLNAEIRKLRGQNEETTHGLQDAEKRQKDFYVDLDTRLRHFESAEAAAKEAAAKEAPLKKLLPPRKQQHLLILLTRLRRTGHMRPAMLRIRPEAMPMR